MSKDEFTKEKFRAMMLMMAFPNIVANYATSKAFKLSSQEIAYHLVKFSRRTK